jgi:hypothetical protein
MTKKEEWNSKTPEERRMYLDYVLINTSLFKANHCSKDFNELGYRYLFDKKFYEVFKIQHEPTRNIYFIFSKEIKL